MNEKNEERKVITAAELAEFLEDLKSQDENISNLKKLQTEMTEVMKSTAEKVRDYMDRQSEIGEAASSLVESLTKASEIEKHLNPFLMEAERLAALFKEE